MTTQAPSRVSAPPARISLSGSGALLLDGADGPFDDAVQRRIWAMAGQLAGMPGVTEAALGMNNLLVLFDPFEVDADRLTASLHAIWRRVEPTPIAGASHEIAVVYGGPRGEDLQAWATHCGMTVAEVVKRHAAGVYTVAAIGGMAGFPYLSGLDPRLAWPRRAIPKARVEEGSVIVGGAQASVMPVTAPTGWHILGHADIKLFDPRSDRPALLAVGDTVRFTVAGVEP